MLMATTLMRRRDCTAAATTAAIAGSTRSEAIPASTAALMAEAGAPRDGLRSVQAVDCEISPRSYCRQVEVGKVCCRRWIPEKLPRRSQLKSTPLRSRISVVMRGRAVEAVEEEEEEAWSCEYL